MLALYHFIYPDCVMFLSAHYMIMIIHIRRSDQSKPWKPHKKKCRSIISHIIVIIIHVSFTRKCFFDFSVRHQQRADSESESDQKINVRPIRTDPIQFSKVGCYNHDIVMIYRHYLLHSSSKQNRFFYLKLLSK